MVAMTKLHGYYRSGPLLQCCYDCQDWEMLSKFYEMEKQWPQVTVWVMGYGWCGVMGGVGDGVMGGVG